MVIHLPHFIEIVKINKAESAKRRKGIGSILLLSLASSSIQD